MAKTHDWSLNNVYTDSVGALTLTAVGTPTAVGSNTGFSFNGTSARARNTSYTKPAGSRTMLVWIKPLATQYTNGRFFCNGHATTLNDNIGTSSSQQLNIRVGTRRATTAGAFTFDTTKKYLIAGVYNGSATTGYYAKEDDAAVSVVADSASAVEVTPTIIGVAANTETTGTNWTNVEIYRAIEFDTALSEATINTWLAAGSEADPTTDAIAISTPARYKTVQRSGSTGSITITGTYTGSPTTIEASFNGGAYSTIVASPAGGTFSGTLSSQAAGQGTLTVRFSNSVGVNASQLDVGIGDVFVVAGQSNAEGRATNARSYSHATLKATVFRQDDAWKDGNDPTDTLTANGSPWPLLATLLMAVTGYPVAFITTATGDTGLYGGTWTKNGAEYADCLQTIQNSGVNNVTGILWHQGETDVNNAVSAVNYETALSTFLDNIQTDSGFSGMKLVAANLGYKSTGGVTRANLDAIRLALLNAVDNDADILPGPILYDVDISADGVHFTTDAELLTLAQRWWRCVYNAFFSGSEVARGPQFVSATRVGTALTVTFTGGQGNLAGQTDVTGWLVTDNGTPITVDSAAASGTTKVVLTLHSTPSGTVLVNFGSFNDGSGSTLKDSGTYPLPPEPVVARTVTAPVAAGSLAVSRLRMAISIGIGI